MIDKSMAKLSPAYREDVLEKPSEDVRQYLDDHFLKSLKNLQKTNPKLLIVFSGGSAVGKSTLAKRIEEEFGALVLENDAIKSHLLTFKPEIDRDDLNVLTWNYSMDLYERLDQLTPNGLVVRDGVIDWYFDRILPIFEGHGYSLFIIAFDLSLQKRKDLITARGDKLTVSADRLMTILHDQDIHMERFRKQYSPDVFLTDDTLFDYEQVINKIRTRINAILA